jgi:hypothetical protein
MSCQGRAREHLEDFASNVALQAAEDLALRKPFGGASRHIGLGARVALHPSEGDAPESGVALPVAAAVEAVPLRLTGRRGERRDAAEGGEGGFRPQALRIVAGHDEEGAGDLGSNAAELEQCAGVSTRMSGDTTLSMATISAESAGAVGPGGATSSAPRSARRRPVQRGSERSGRSADVARACATRPADLQAPRPPRRTSG